MPLNSLAVTRFQGGINTSPDGTIWGGSMPYIDPTPFHEFFEDFDYFTAANWTVTETQAGATQALLDGNNGLLLLTNSAGAADINQVQKIGESYLPVVGKKFFMKARFAISDATLSAFAIGIQVANADGTALATALDGIFFLKATAAATIALYSRQDNTTGSVNSGAIATVVAATMMEVACFFDGVDRLYYSVNGTVTGYITVSAALLPNTECAPIISLKNGEAVAKTATVDYLMFAQER
jgi:hypothetical protein